MKSNIRFGKIWEYLSEDTGKVIHDKHPAIIIEKNNEMHCFAFTHDKYYGIENEEAKYSCKTLPEVSLTTIKDKNELLLTKNYYSEIMNDKFKPFEERKRAKFAIEKSLY